MNDITVAMFAVANQDAAIAFYTQKLGFELRADTRFGPNGEYRWVEVAPAGSHARLALNEPMGGARRWQHRRRDARRDRRAPPTQCDR